MDEAPTQAVSNFLSRATLRSFSACAIRTLYETTYVALVWIPFTTKVHTRSTAAARLLSAQYSLVPRPIPVWIEVLEILTNG